MRILIVDDEPLALERLAHGLSLLTGITVVGSATNGDEALEKIESLAPDVVLLDIQMPGRTGVQVARALAGSPGPEVVFVTAFTDFATDAFAVDAADYVLKPVRLDRLHEAVNRARRRLDSRQASLRLAVLEAEMRQTQPTVAGAVDGDYDTELWIPLREGVVRVDIDQIRRIEAARDYALIHTRMKTYILRITMSELERRLDPAKILRVHRSAFIRLDTVSRVERDGRSLLRLCTEDGALVEVGASYARRVTNALGLDYGVRRAAHA